MSPRVGPGRTAHPLPKVHSAGKPKVHAKPHQPAAKVDVAKAKKTVAEVNVAGHTPLPTIALGSLEVDANVEQQPIRTWQIENGQAREVALKPTTAKLPPPTRYAALSEQQLSDAVKAAHEQRSEELLAGGVRTMPMAMPEDGNVKVRAYHLAVLGEDATCFGYPLAMAQVGKAEGLKMSLERLEKDAKTKAGFEAKAADDLKRGGLTVHRLAGVFMSDDGQPMNFLNGEAAKGADGKGFYIALGGDVRAEKYVVQKLGRELPSGFSNIHFLDRKLTGYTLNSDGGLSCRAKLEGELA